MARRNQRREVRRGFPRLIVAVVAAATLQLVVSVAVAGPLAAVAEAQTESSSLSQPIGVTILPDPNAPAEELPVVPGADDATKSPGGLAFTGANMTNLVVVAVVLVGAGLVLLVAARRKRTLNSSEV